MAVQNDKNSYREKKHDDNKKKKKVNWTSAKAQLVHWRGRENKRLKN